MVRHDKTRPYGSMIPISWIPLRISWYPDTRCRRRWPLTPTDDVIGVVECPDDGDRFPAVAEHDHYFLITHVDLTTALTDRVDYSLRLSESVITVRHLTSVPGIHMRSPVPEALARDCGIITNSGALCRMQVKRRCWLGDRQTDWYRYRLKPRSHYDVWKWQNGLLLLSILFCFLSAPWFDAVISHTVEENVMSIILIYLKITQSS